MAIGQGMIGTSDGKLYESEYDLAIDNHVGKQPEVQLAGDLPARGTLQDLQNAPYVKMTPSELQALPSNRKRTPQGFPLDEIGVQQDDGTWSRVKLPPVRKVRAQG